MGHEICSRESSSTGLSDDTLYDQVPVFRAYNLIPIEITCALNTTQVCLPSLSLIWVGLEISEAYFRATTAAKLKSDQLSSLSRLVPHGPHDLQAAIDGAVHDLTAPLRGVPITGGMRTKRTTEENVSTAAVKPPSEVANGSGEIHENGAAMDSTVQGTDQAGDTAGETSPM